MTTHQGYPPPERRKPSKLRITAIILGIVIVKLIVIAAALYGLAAAMGWVFYEANNPH